MPRTITYPIASNASSPKAFHTLAYFISVSLIVFPDRALSFKGFTPYYTQSVGAKNSFVFKTSRPARIIRVVFSSIFDLCALASGPPTRIDFSSSFAPSPSPCSTLPQICSSRYPPPSLSYLVHRSRYIVFPQRNCKHE